MKKIDRDQALTIVAALLVLFSAMLNPVVTIAMVVIILIVAAIGKRIRHA